MGRTKTYDEAKVRQTFKTYIKRRVEENDGHAHISVRTLAALIPKMAHSTAYWIVEGMVRDGVVDRCSPGCYVGVKD
jgi:hypothetical protein